MLPQYCYQRTHMIKVGDEAFTCFILDVDKKQYICSARHALDKFDGSSVEIRRDKGWERLPVKLIGSGNGPCDLCVLATSVLLVSGICPEVSQEAFMAQEVYFLGYPFGMTYEYNSYGVSPVPFARAALLSCTTKTTEGVGIWFLDGMNNRGFSGGPVLFRKLNDHGLSVDFSKLYLGALISSYEPEKLMVKDIDTKWDTGFSVNVNSGIVKAICAGHLRELINKNPAGYSISDEKPLFMIPKS